MKKISLAKKALTKLLAIAMVTSIILSGCGDANQGSGSGEDASEGELKTIRMGVMTGTTSQWYAEVGVEAGIYEKRGLNVEITEYAAGINTVDALVTGQLDIGMVADFAGINRIGNTSDLTNLRFISQLAHSAVSELYVNPDKITGLSDLKGKNMLTLLGTVWEYWNGKTIEYAGLTEDDVNLVAVDSAQDGIAIATAGDADSFWVSGESASRLAALGWVPILTQEELGTQTYQYYMSIDSYLSENQETLKEFYAATEDIIAYIAGNEDEAAEIVYDTTGMSQDVFKTSNAVMVNDIAFTQEAYDDLADINEWAYAYGFYSAPYLVEDYIDTTILSAYNADKVSWEVK